MTYFKIKFLLWLARQHQSVGELFLWASRKMIAVCEGCEKRATRLTVRAKGILSSATERK